MNMDLYFEPFAEKYMQVTRAMLEQDPQSRRIFLRVLQDMPQAHTLVFEGENPVAVFCTEETDGELFFMLLVAPEFRRRGIGTAVLERAVSEHSGEIRIVHGFFNRDCAPAQRFAEKHGYTRHYDCAYMEYTGGPFPQTELPVRPYTDEDYSESQAVRAEAFHRMRVMVGDFPESTVAQPSREDRLEWLRDAENYFVYTDRGEIVGVGHLEGNEIHSVSVRTDRQGQGIGRKFVPYLANVLMRRGHRTVALECVVGNPARKLYESLGFREAYTERFVRKHTAEEGKR